ncbi:hypothetical protein SYNTR_0231 [Candidatus Syntrophocurvum alkaliphilum]|uniref:Sporulation protein YtfJ n=1 Tax=Candidatus Syntrophocurvum alkaliphilum TaxID=2293317 RepID=A0A6I6DBI0_9FIRM|nr:spore germination protein GerW family protein [Candidatus Syntrophocurvum alkaliphilum]QGT98824.1 hypothetical protein SYNTR_0231 [Candidatus Syntrophocurvum alkaliphilum]
MDFNENMNTLLERLEKFFRTETVVGEPIQLGNITLVPIIGVSFGLGGGGGSGKDSSGNDGSGGGAGVGGKITPNAILVIKNEEVSVIPLNEKTSIDKIVSMVPEIISKITPDKQTQETNS